MNYKVIRADELLHHGILGQKWGVRRFQNEDMSLTPAGKERYGSAISQEPKKTRKQIKFEKRYDKTSADVKRLGKMHSELLSISSKNNHDGTLSFKESISKEDAKRSRKLGKEFLRANKKLGVKYGYVKSSIERTDGEVFIRTQIYDKKLKGIVYIDTEID